MLLLALRASNQESRSGRRIWCAKSKMLTITYGHCEHLAPRERAACLMMGSRSAANPSYSTLKGCNGE